MGKLPITLTMTDGILTLTDGRLTFATKRTTRFDHPIGEFHSVAPAAKVGFHVWHASRCYKFVPGHEIVSAVNSGNDLVDVAANVGQLSRAIAADQRMRDQRDQWVELLRPLVGSPPPGLRVRPPWPTWALMLVVLGVTVMIIAIITAIVLLTSWLTS